MGRASRLPSRQPRFVPLLALAAVTTSCAQAARPADAPAEPPPATSHAPDVTRVSLERTPCFGACATFTLQVDANGQANLSLPGKRAAKLASDGANDQIVLKGQVPAAQMQQLLGTLRDGDFASLEADYRANISDMPGAVITVATASGTASTRVYGVPCASQAATDGIDPALGPAKPVPDVFCQAAKQLDAMACEVYAHGKQTLQAGVEARFPPRCGDDA